MKTLIVIAAVILAVSALSLHEQWADFKVEHGKDYKNIAEETARFKIFQQNLKTIEEHNAKYEAGLSSYWMGVNKFSDMSDEEFQAMINRQHARKPKIQGELHVQDTNVFIPAEIDWRTKGAVTEIKDQGKCGSCWAFSAVGALEGQNAIKNNKKISLSVQQLIDCSEGYHDGDCNGGDQDDAFDYVKDNGIESDEEYPYKADKFDCKASSDKSVIKIRGYRRVKGTTEALKRAVGSVGPISVNINSVLLNKNYKGGIFDGPCYNDSLDHSVLAIGYGERPEPYWIVKNSWGKSWGEEGYFRLARGNNLCGIAEDNYYPFL